jgi:uncharacterized Zn-binding protein involved in type VI secretion
MSPFAARQNDPVSGTDIHIVLVPSPGGPVPTPLPHPFSGMLVESLSADVLINGLPAAVAGSVARNLPPHLPTPPGTSFSKPPTNRGTVQLGSLTVQINGKQAARVGDPVLTCNDPVDAPTGTITGGSMDVDIG